MCDGPSGFHFCAYDEEDAVDCLGCASPVPGGVCDPVSQCGCRADQHCQMISEATGSTTRCVTPGERAAGEACSADSECAAGLSCGPSGCAPYCKPGSAQACDGCREVLDGVGLCYDTCDFPEQLACAGELVCSAVGVCGPVLDPCPASFVGDGECDGPSGTRFCASDEDDPLDCQAPDAGL